VILFQIIIGFLKLNLKNLSATASSAICEADVPSNGSHP
jgi:hypothetical protein